MAVFANIHFQLPKQSLRMLASPRPFPMKKSGLTSTGGEGDFSSPSIQQKNAN
jgi:hypothetical protein